MSVCRGIRQPGFSSYTSTSSGLPCDDGERLSPIALQQRSGCVDHFCRNDRQGHVVDWASFDS